MRSADSDADEAPRAKLQCEREGSAGSGEGMASCAAARPVVRLSARSHVYTVDGVRAIATVTQLARAVQEPFETAAVIGRMGSAARARALRGYSGVPDRAAEDRFIAASWDATGRRAAELGTAVHARIAALLGHEAPPPPAAPALAAQIDDAVARFEQFYQAEFAGHTPVEIEQPIGGRYCGGELVLAGTPDALLRRPDGEYVLVDWKTTTKPLDADYRRTMRSPLSHLPDTKLTLYSLQLHLYREILADWCGIVVPLGNQLIVARRADGSWYSTPATNLHRAARTLLTQGLPLLAQRR